MKGGREREREGGRERGREGGRRGRWREIEREGRVGNNGGREGDGVGGREKETGVNWTIVVKCIL